MGFAAAFFVFDLSFFFAALGLSLVLAMMILLSCPLKPANGNCNSALRAVGETI